MRDENSPRGKTHNSFSPLVICPWNLPELSRSYEAACKAGMPERTVQGAVLRTEWRPVHFRCDGCVLADPASIRRQTAG